MQLNCETNKAQKDFPTYSTVMSLYHINLCKLEFLGKFLICIIQHLF